MLAVPRSILDPACAVYPILVIDAEALGNPVYVVEVGDDLDTTGDTGIVKPLIPKDLNVLVTDLSRAPGQLGGKPDQRQSRFIQAGGFPVDRNPIDQSIVGDLSPEVVEMSRRSVVTVVDLRGNGCEKLTLGPA